MLFNCDNDEIHYNNQKKMLNHPEELITYVENNRHVIPNYGNGDVMVRQLQVVL